MDKKFKLVTLESPYAGGVEKNVEYARKCMLDCLQRGEAPFVSHLLYTPCLNDTVPLERELGMQAGFAWRPVTDYTVVYHDLGISKGMEAGIQEAINLGHYIEYRKINCS